MMDFAIHSTLNRDGVFTITRTGQDRLCNRITLESFADLLERNPGCTKAEFLDLVELFDLNPRVGQKWLRRGVSAGRIDASWDGQLKRYEL